MRFIHICGSILVVTLIAVSAGCDMNRGALPVGGVFEFDPNDGVDIESDAGHAEGGPQVQDPDWDHDNVRGRDDARLRDGFANRDNSRDRRDRDSGKSKKSAGGWGNARRLPSDSMPSKTTKWGGDRRMPSDSMPSKKAKWGANRKMPSDSMPSKKSDWGSKRSMPSDNMPSKSFDRRSVFDD